MIIEGAFESFDRVASDVTPASLSSLHDRADRYLLCFEDTTQDRRSRSHLPLGVPFVGFWRTEKGGAEIRNLTKLIPNTYLVLPTK